MKILLDENIPADFKKKLKKKYDVKHINDIKKGMKDKEVVDLAQKEKRIIVTSDIDFRELRKKNDVCVIKLGYDSNKFDILINILDYIKSGKEDWSNILFYYESGRYYKEVKKVSKRTGKFKNFQKYQLNLR